MTTDDPLFLGLDTGGTYTDAVLFSQARGVVAKAKALTTRHDLSQGICAAADRVMEAGGAVPGAVRLVSMSTTLATNALVEGQGGRVCLVMIGFSAADLARDGLKEALGADPVIMVPGGHDVHGNAARLDLSDLVEALPALAPTVSAFAVCAYFATRNPLHEVMARDAIAAACDLPVTMSHELSSRLGGPRRALTTLLNARLVFLIDRLVAATSAYLADRAIDAPLMVVRGDGALVSAAFARRRPIETILSGPAASIVGARHLTGLADAVVSDIGGTTTDVAILAGGVPRLDPEGATVGGFRTMVEAVAMRTFGLGGDSEVAIGDGGLESAVRLGPRRLVPLALAAHLHGAAVLAALERQQRAAPGRLDGRFAMRTGVPERLAAGLAPAEAKLYARIADVPMPLDRVLEAPAQGATLDRLVARGLVHLCGFTPSDAAHVTGQQANWDGEAARLGASLMARRRDGRGMAVAASPETLADRVLAALTRASAERILETAFAEDGLDGAALVAGPLVQRALERRGGVAVLAIGLDRPVIGLGASAALHYAGLPGLVGNACVLPPDADVANAIGAVTGQVRVARMATVTQPVEGLFRVSDGGGIEDHPSETAALAAARVRLETAVRQAVGEAGGEEIELTHAAEIDAVPVEGQRSFVEARVVVTASGRPRIAAARTLGHPVD